MKAISLNGKYKYKSDVKNKGIENKWYFPENYNIINRNLNERGFKYFLQNLNFKGIQTWQIRRYKFLKLV